jgi:hypothetical protein
MTEAQKDHVRPGFGKRTIDLTGQRFGRLTVQNFVGRNLHGCFQWACICDCGTPKVVLRSSLRDGNSRSCGCLRAETRHAQPRAIDRHEGIRQLDLGRSQSAVARKLGCSRALINRIIGKQGVAAQRATADTYFAAHPEAAR